MFGPLYQIAAIAPAANGWNITSAVDGTEPKTSITIVTPILSAGMNNRNLQRCILSTGYLALMLWILLLAILFTFYRPTNAKSALIRIGFMAGLALLFSLVGNRRLIRDAIHFALYVPTAPQVASMSPTPRLQSRGQLVIRIPSNLRQTLQKRVETSYPPMPYHVEIHSRRDTLDLAVSLSIQPCAFSSKALP
jgi:hypothetical protein